MLCPSLLSHCLISALNLTNYSEPCMPHLFLPPNTHNTTWLLPLDITTNPSAPLCQIFQTCSPLGWVCYSCSISIPSMLSISTECILHIHFTFTPASSMSTRHLFWEFNMLKHATDMVIIVSTEKNLPVRWNIYFVSIFTLNNNRFI